MRNQIGERGLSLIKQWEGLRLKAYQDSGGKWTIGYGSTRSAAEGWEITALQADQLLAADLVGPVSMFAANTALTNSQFDALVSFVFNVGSEHYASSTLASYIKEHRWFEAARELLRWHYVKGERNRGLLRRRVAEAELFCADDWSGE